MTGSAAAARTGPACEIVATYAAPEALPAEAAGLLTLSEGRSLFASLAWYRTVLGHGLDLHERACFAVWPCEGRPAAIFPLARSARGELRGLTTPYTCVYTIPLAARLGRAEIVQAGEALGRFCRGQAAMRLDALPPEWPALAPLLEGLRHAGLAVRRFDHFGNWHEPVAGLSWSAYLAARPGALRETVRRRLRRAENDARVTFEMVTGGDGLDASIEAFESVYRRSWKEPEPFPHFNAALMRATAPLGSLRLGLLRLDGEPVAAQCWIVEDGRAIVLKLAHDERLKSMSPGTVLTAAVLRRLLDEERVREIDFGRGDDPYKSGWANRRRQRIGVLLINPRHPRGLAMLAREELGAGRRIVRAWLSGARLLGAGAA